MGSNFKFNLKSPVVSTLGYSSGPDPDVTWDTFSFPVGGHLAIQQALDKAKNAKKNNTPFENNLNWKAF